MLNLKLIDKKTLIIAEIGPNHNGSIKRAKKMISKLAKSSVDCVKFQLGDPEKIFSKDSFKANYQKNSLKKLSIKKISERNQLSKKDHLELSKLCKQKKLIYACSAFDLNSLKFLDKEINVPFFKIPSGEIFSLDMLNYISKQKKPIFISTGMVNFKQLSKILKIVTKNRNKKIVIMHCVSSYPANKFNLNLNILNLLRKKFKFRIGYSDHSIGEEACLAAVAKNACVIEKHVTLSNYLVGPDHKASMKVSDFKVLANKVRILEKILGKEEKKFSADELNVHQSSRKSIVSAKFIKKNKKIMIDDLCFKRPGVGINPLEINQVIGKKAKKDIKENIILKKSFFY